MIIFATGISGSGRLDYLMEVSRVSKGSIEVIDIGSLMFDKSKQLGIEIPEGKILDLDYFALNYLRAVTFEDLLKNIHKYRGNSKKDLIVSTHTCFRWKKHLTPAFNFFYLNQLNPDVYVTILDNVHYIWARLSKSQWRGRLTLKDILVWRDEELFITEMLAQYQRKPFYVISRNEPPELLKDVICRVEKINKGKRALRAYLSYPITYMKGDPQWMVEKDKIKKKLRDEGIIVFDPITVEEADIIGLAVEARKKGEKSVRFEMEGQQYSIPLDQIETSKEDIYDQIVVRDYKLIDQSDIVIVYYPITTLSAGVLSEINYSFTHNKEVYAVFPHEDLSPFFSYYTTGIFHSVEELLSYLKEINKI